MTPPNRNYQEKTFIPAAFLNELVKNLNEPSLVRRWITLNRFLIFFIRPQQQRETEPTYYHVLNRLCRRPGGDYADNVYITDALRKLMAFNNLFLEKKNGGEKVTDEDVLNYEGGMQVESLDEETYLLAMREVAKFVAWYINKPVPREIIEETQELVDSRRGLEPEIDLGDDDFVNQAQRSPIVLIVDNSTPMESFLGAVTDGIESIFRLIRGNRALQRGAEVCIVTTATGGKAQLLQDFTSAQAAEARLTADPALLDGKGPSHLDDAITLAVDAIERFSTRIREDGQSYYTPWVGIFSCGRWLRSARVNTRLDECIEQLRRMNSPEVHDISLHAVVVNQKALTDPKQKENLESLGGEMHEGTDLRRVFNDLFMSVKRVREFSGSDEGDEGEGADGEMERPVVPGVPLKNSTSL